jgi:Ca2+-binding EF-hand superfamily protein
MRTSTFFVTAALVAGLATSAFAQPPAGGGRGPAQTPEERAAAFDKADANKDGKLDKAEFKATLPEAMQANADMAFDRRDADKDGFVSKAEFTAAGGRRGPPAQ